MSELGKLIVKAFNKACEVKIRVRVRVRAGQGGSGRVRVRVEGGIRVKV